MLRRRRKANALVEPFTHIRGQFAEGRQLAYLNEVALIYGYPLLRENLERLEIGGGWLQLVLASVAPEQEADGPFRLLIRALRELEVSRQAPLLDLWVQLRMLALLGVGPELSHCCECGNPDAPVLHPPSGGVLCRGCSGGRSALAPAALELLRRLQASRANVIAELTPEPALVGRLRPLLGQFF